MSQIFFFACDWLIDTNLPSHMRQFVSRLENSWQTVPADNQLWEQLSHLFLRRRWLAVWDWLQMFGSLLHSSGYRLCPPPSTSVDIMIISLLWILVGPIMSDHRDSLSVFMYSLSPGTLYVGFSCLFMVIYIVLLDAGQFTCWNLLFVVDVHNYIREHLCPI